MLKILLLDSQIIVENVKQIASENSDEDEEVVDVYELRFP